MTRPGSRGKGNQQSGAPYGTSLEQAETDIRPLLDRVRDTLTRRRSSRAYRTVEGRPATPYAPYPNTEEAEAIEHAEYRRQILAHRLIERRRENEQGQITQRIAEQFAQLTPLRASTFPFLGMQSLAPTNERLAEPLQPVDLPSRLGRQSTAASVREDGQDRGLALLNHLRRQERPVSCLRARRNRLQAARSEAEARTQDPFEGHDSFDTTPPPPYVRRWHNHQSIVTEELPNNNVRPRPRRAAPPDLGCYSPSFPPAPQAQSTGLTSDIRESASVAVGLNNDGMHDALSDIVAGSRVRIRWHGGRVLRLWRGDVLVASFALDDDMHAEVGGVPSEVPKDDTPEDTPEYDAWEHVTEES